MMFFSFIVPVYNTSKYLTRCIESILCQKGASFEILLVDDGSTDNSGEMCDQYLNLHPDVVRVIHKDNEGLLLTRRRGLQEARGDWFINVDSDDYIAPDLLESVVKAINRYQPDMVMYNFQYFTDAGVVSSSRLKIPNESVFNSDNKEQVYSYRLLSNDINSMCMKALKRDIVDIDSDYHNCGIRNMCEDAVQVLPLLTNAQTIVYLSFPFYQYRKGEDNITSSRTYESWIASKTCFLITERYLNVWNVSDELRHGFYTQYAELLSSFIRWVFDQSEEQLPMLLDTIIHIVSAHPAFQRCMQMYQKQYAKTTYLKFSVPKIMRYVQKENVRGLKRYFALEGKVLSHR